MIWFWTWLFATALLVYESDCKSFDPKKRGYIEAKWRPGYKNFKCPIGSYVKSFDIAERKVYCEKQDKAIPDERSYELCEWQTRCYRNTTVPKGSDNVWGIARGLSFSANKQTNIVPKIQMFCCLGSCSRYQCKDYKKKGPMVDFGAKNNRFLNYAVWNKRQNVIKGEFCRPTCALTGKGKGSGVNIGIPPLPKNCRGARMACTFGAQCCTRNCKNARCCKPIGADCNNFFDCCGNRCVNYQCT